MCHKGGVSTPAAGSPPAAAVGTTAPTIATLPGMSVEAEARIAGWSGHRLPHRIKDLWRRLHDAKTTQDAQYILEG